MNTVIIDDREFEFECSIFPVAGEDAILLTKSAVKSLKIKESIFTGWMVGEITIDNQRDLTESSTPVVQSGSSVLYLKIRDLSTNSLCSDVKNGGDFYIENFFNITKARTIKNKNLIIAEFEDYTLFTIKKLTAVELEEGSRSPAERRVRGRRKGLASKDEPSEKGLTSKNETSNSYGRKGDIIKELLLQGLKYKEVDKNKKTSVRGALLKPWDRGKYLYTQQPVQQGEKIFDTIQRIRKSYVPDVEGIEEDIFDLSIFYTDRDGNISLTPLSKLLEESIQTPEEYVLELAFIEGGIGATNNAPTDKKITTDGNSLGELSIITQSEFNIRQEDYTRQFNESMNKFYHSVKSSSSTSYQEILSDFPERLQNYHKKKFVTIFGDDVVSSINFPKLDLGGETRVDATNDYSHNLVIGRNIYGSEIMTSLVLDGYTCEITMRGSLHRTHGKIIEIGTTNTSPNPNDYKKLGKWFVKTVLHEFADDKYHNTLECCKTYATKPS